MESGTGYRGEIQDPREEGGKGTTLTVRNQIWIWTFHPRDGYKIQLDNLGGSCLWDPIHWLYRDAGPPIKAIKWWGTGTLPIISGTPQFPISVSDFTPQFPIQVSRGHTVQCKKAVRGNGGIMRKPIGIGHARAFTNQFDNEK